MLGRLCVLAFVGAAATAGAVPDVNAGEVLDRILARGYIKMNGVPDWPPYSSKDVNGNYLGFDVDVADEVELEVEIEIGDENQLEIEISW